MGEERSCEAEDDGSDGVGEERSCEAEDDGSDSVGEERSCEAEDDGSDVVGVGDRGEGQSRRAEGDRRGSECEASPGKWCQRRRRRRGRWRWRPGWR